MSSHNLLCMECAAGKPEGSYQIYARSAWAEPAEYQRITRGVAGQPIREQRTIFINGAPQPVMDLAFYNCDLCCAPIHPGEQCAAQTVWIEGQGEPDLWEAAYFEKADANSLRQT